MIIFKSGLNKTEHLQDKSPKDHRDVLDLVWNFRHASPHIGGFVDDMAEWHKWGALDQETFYKMHAGTFAGQELRMVAMMPPAVAAMLHHYHPEILKDKNEFYKFLKAHPEYAVPEGAA